MLFEEQLFVAFSLPKLRPDLVSPRNQPMRAGLTIFKKGLILVSIPLLFQMAFIGLVAVMERGNADASR
jgi:hypothetical protein